MLNAICASKLYRASTRKDKILAAFQDPINTELVGQLAKALDEEYQTPEYLVKESDHEEPGVQEVGTAPSEPADSEPDNVPAPAPHHSSPSGPPPSSDGPSDESDIDTSEPSGGDEPTSAEPDLIEESTSANGKPVTASRARNMFRDMKQVSDQVKGMLNMNQTTSGVSRILCKENELWIYYNDDVNLNNVMAEVIELLNISGYPYLEFNRLARSDNAIVFQIQFQHGIMQMNIATAVDQ